MTDTKRHNCITVLLLLFCFLGTLECFSFTSCRSVSSLAAPPATTCTNTMLPAKLNSGRDGAARSSSETGRVVNNNNASQGKGDSSILLGDNNNKSIFFNRRDMVSSLALITTMASTISWPDAAHAAEASPPPNPFLQYRKIPTFCIVNGAGVPYMIFNRAGASATGYFFMSYQVALGVLSDAKKKEGAAELWDDARIVVIPLDIALKLSLAKISRKAINSNKEQIVDTFNDIVPSEEGVADAQFLDKKSGKNAARWLEKGRTPLFFVEGNSGGAPTRYYFNRKDLLADTNSSESSSPDIQLVEMADLFRKTPVDKVQNIVLVPSLTTQRSAEELMQEQQKEGKTTSPYRFKEVVIVSSG